MKKKLIKSQLSNYDTYRMYKRQFFNLAENVFNFKELPTFIDTSFLNKQLLLKGSIAFFKDEVMGILALPYSIIGSLDVYGRPTSIQVMGQNGYVRSLKKDEYIIMYDNNGRYPIYLDILQYAERVADIVRTIDINVKQQKSPRYWKVPHGMEKTFQDIINNIEGNQEYITTYEDIDLSEVSAVLTPSPYVSDKLCELKDKTFNEFLRLIGIANMSYQKKERNIRDEITAMQGGTIASRYSRFTPREKAVKEINEKWGLNIEVEYYDGLPTTLQETLDNSFEESEVEDDVVR